MKNIFAKRRYDSKTHLYIRQNSQKYFFILLALGVFFLNMKRIFMDFDTDVEYAITMSYRLAMGDHMFSQMREPHQTSAFLLAFFIKIWLLITGTTTGLVIYLNMISLLIKYLVVLFFYNTFKKYCDHRIVLIMSLFLAAVQVKFYVLLDFSNMHIYSSILLLCCLARYQNAPRNRLWLFLSALCLCLEILSYPSCLLVYFIVIALICNMSKQRLKDCLLFSSVCGFMGISYIAYFGIRLGWGNFFLNVYEVVVGDGSHSDGLLVKFSRYLFEAGQHLLLYGILAAVSLVATLLIWRRLRRDKMLLFFFALLWLFDLLCIITWQYDRIYLSTFWWAEFYPPIIILGISLLSHCDETERKLFWAGVFLSIGSMFSVLLLTNLTLGTAIAYQVLGVTVAFIPIGHRITALLKNWVIPFAMLMFLILFKGFFLFLSMSMWPQHIFVLGNIVKAGPAIGILSDYMGPYTMNSSLSEWPLHIHAGDRVLVVSEGVVGSLKYLYEDVTISVDSTICTPTYNEKLLTYWEQYPEKFPNVVVVDCWFGHLNVDEESWIMQWVYEEFGADSYQDGTYLRYYRRQE